MLNSTEKNNKLNIVIQKISTNIWRAEITIDAQIINSLYDQTLNVFQKETILPGFKKETAPISYLEEHYKDSIYNNVKNYRFKHTVLDVLMDELMRLKISIANYPRLVSVNLEKNKNAKFCFDISVASPLILKEWKYFIFRAPKRKRYKDLDKQVTFFIKKELSMFKKSNPNQVEEGDWVYFNSELVNNKNELLPGLNTGNFWIKINNKYMKRPFQSLLNGKNIDESFITNKLPIKNDFSQEEEENNSYSFKITIKKIAKGKHFSLESFKNTFKLKSKIEIHNKLIEVFSFRNDISQRKSIIEEIFHLLLSKHRFEIPKHFSVRRQEDILDYLKNHPDYNVYKQNKDFYEQVIILAEKQLKEEILIDQLAYRENISVTPDDIKNYLNLFNNNRLREFIYFKPILEKIEESDFPLQTGLLKQYALREKALNEIIHELTK